MDNNKLMEKMVEAIKKELVKAEVIEALRGIASKSMEHNHALEEIIGKKNYRKLFKK